MAGENPVFFENREAFLKGLLESTAKLFAAERVSFYYCDDKNALLRLMMRRSGGASFEADENVRLSPDSPASGALSSHKPVVFKNKAGHFLLAPFRIEIYSADARREAPLQGLIKLERSLKKGRRFSPAEAALAHEYIGDFMHSYYKAEFSGLNKKYAKNLAVITELTEIFANSLRVRESFQHILTGSQIRRLTEKAGDNEDPSWSPDGRFIAFTSTRRGHKEIFVMDADGSAPHPLTELPGSSFTPSWSP